MKVCAFLLPLLIALLPLQPTDTSESTGSAETEFLVGVIDADLETMERVAGLSRLWGARVIEFDLGGGYVRVRIESARQDLLLRELEKDQSVAYVELNGMGKTELVPNDPEYWRQWGMTSIAADAAWNIQTGRHEILVAIIDTGVDSTHIELYSHYAGGYDFVNHDGDPWDDVGHGTQMAGTLVGAINNNAGIAGVAQVRFLALKVCKPVFLGIECPTSAIASAIVHAARSNARIISMSLSAPQSQTLHDAVKFAYASGSLLVAAAGSSGCPGNQVKYPAAYPEVIAVTGMNRNNEVFTPCIGPEVDLAAPGSGIYTTDRYQGYTSVEGSSIAVPQVAGAAALVWSQFEGFSRNEVRDILTSTADDIEAPGFDNKAGYGRVDAISAVLRGVDAHDHVRTPFDGTGTILLEIPSTGGLRIPTTPDTVHGDGHQLLAYALGGPTVEWSVWFPGYYMQGTAGTGGTLVWTPHDMSFIVSIGRYLKVAWLFCGEQTWLICETLDHTSTAHIQDASLDSLLSVPALASVTDTLGPDLDHSDGHNLLVSASPSGNGVEWFLWSHGTSPNYGYTAGAVTVSVPHYKSFALSIRRGWRVGWLFCRENDSYLACGSIQYGTNAYVQDNVIDRLLEPVATGFVWDLGSSLPQYEHMLFIAASGSCSIAYTVWRAAGGSTHGSLPAGASQSPSFPHYQSFMVAIWGSNGCTNFGGWLFCGENNSVLACSFL